MLSDAAARHSCQQPTVDLMEDWSSVRRPCATWGWKKVKPEPSTTRVLEGGSSFWCYNRFLKFQIDKKSFLMFQLVSLGPYVGRIQIKASLRHPHISWPIFQDSSSSLPFPHLICVSHSAVTFTLLPLPKRVLAHSSLPAFKHSVLFYQRWVFKNAFLTSVAKLPHLPSHGKSRSFC